MYNINFYKDEKGNEPVKEYIISLKAKNTKDSLIKLQKQSKGNPSKIIWKKRYRSKC